LEAIDKKTVAQLTLASRIALVRAQLDPIVSRRALLDSYRRESLCRLATTALLAGSEADVLEAAYSLRWAELERDEAPGLQGGSFPEPVDA
jgi:hypothetical protein